MAASRGAAQSNGAGGAGEERRGRARRELVTNDLLDKATALFADQGYEATTLQDIADAVGVSRPSLYHYVSSKEELLAALVEKVSSGLAESLAALRSREDLAPRGKLRVLTEMLVRDRATSPGQFRILDRSENMLPPDVRSRHLQARREVLAEMTGLIDEGIAAGEFRPVDARTAALGILGMCNWVAWWFKPGAGHDVEPVVDQLSQAALDMTAVPTTSGKRIDSAGAALAQVRAGLDLVERYLPDA